jgi:hypothetical protein
MTPRLATVAKRTLLLRNQAYAMTNREPLTLLAQKAVDVSQASDLGIDAEYENATQGWFNQLAARQGFLLAALARNLIPSGPLHFAIGVSAGGVLASAKPEAGPQVFSRVTYSRDRLSPITTTALSVVTQEALDAVKADGSDAVNTTVELAVVTAVDMDAYALITNSSTGGAVASGVAANNARNDIAAAFRGVFSAGQSTEKAFFVCDPGTAIALSLLAQRGGGPAIFPDLFPGGGSLIGLPVLVSSGWPAGTLTLCDGSQMIAGLQAIGIQASTSGSYSASLSPAQNAATGQGEAMISDYQSNAVIVRAITRWHPAKTAWRIRRLRGAQQGRSPRTSIRYRRRCWL